MYPLVMLKIKNVYFPKALVFFLDGIHYFDVRVDICFYAWKYFDG